MLSKDKIKRINELSKKNKAGTITEEEAIERKKLHNEYIQSMRNSIGAQIEGIKVVDPEGEDLTPNKVKEIQKERGLHNRDNK
ncbi:DUF896 domain-containing protein [Aerococcaceae bacterium INB8]|uniref:UPF0291 protein HW423_04365 n=1 Tax=Ruoffia halotolerans TaxID=2748684 RepID=A0A839A598_9LACT|nr:DUF896 domain-containing protein [Ruoffia halotolerans]MBA5729014.1 DUF896 domain-containing protein [Ruoffia halotolerans]